ncbi:MAG: M14 family zinc carboxypeptidase, partial [Actinomycetota bacterium]
MSRTKLLPALLLIAVAAVSPAARGACSPDAGPDPSVTAPGRSIPGFPDRRARTVEINRYVRLVDHQSARVVSGTFATSWGGTDLSYALVSTERNLRAVERIAGEQKRLRDPRVTSASAAERIASRLPAIVWYAGNVHGNETSGADAALQILYELAAGRTCLVEQVLSNLVVGIIPTQNPDGRDNALRENGYGFDMNRDWFAETQPETAGKLDLLRRYPPLLFIDAHEQGSSDFFFPPNADPIHHEISPQSLHWINDLYAPALAAAFDERRMSDPTQWDYFNYDIYDLFYMGYGDTVPTTAFTAAGMTFEKGTADTERQRMTEQFVAGWTTLRTAAEHRASILRDYYRAHATAVGEGRGGRLEPNQIIQPENTLQRRVPSIGIRHYFLETSAGATEAAKLVARLMRMGVEVYRLDRDLRVPDLRRMGRRPASARVPAGSYWIPMTQPQKRWIQALLGEDSYVPFPYFYDVTSWSNPLLMNVSAGASGARMSPHATLLRDPTRGEVVNADGAPYFWFEGSSGSDVAAALALARQGRDVRRLAQATEANGVTLPRGSFVVLDVALQPLSEIAERFGVLMHGGLGAPPAGRRIRLPKIALYAPITQLPVGLTVDESFGHMRYLLEQAWGLPIGVLNGIQLASGALSSGGYDILIVPGVGTTELSLARSQIRSWIEGGGMYIGTARPGGTGGTPFAVSSGFTSAGLVQNGGLVVPGSQFRVQLDAASPLTLGAPRFAYWYQLGEDALSPTTTGRTAAGYPSTTPDFWISGYTEGADALRGTAGLVEETLGSGRVVLFSGEPNFRAFTDGTAFLLANALV